MVTDALLAFAPAVACSLVLASRVLRAKLAPWLLPLLHYLTRVNVVVLQKTSATQPDSSTAALLLTVSVPE